MRIVCIKVEAAAFLSELGAFYDQEPNGNKVSKLQELRGDGCGLVQIFCFHV